MSTAKESDGAFSEIAMPAGEILHAQLKTAYVDFSSLLGDLAKNNFSGYVSLEADDCRGVVLFQNGNAIDAVCAQYSQRDLSQIAMAELNAVAHEKRGSLNVVRTSAELAASCAALLHGEPVHNNLDAQAIRLDGLLKSLEENRFTGSVVIRNGDDASAGFNLLFEGKSLGAFYRENGTLLPDQARVDQLATARGAMISVISAPSLGEPIDLTKIPTVRSHVRLLTDAVHGCFIALTEIAGTNMVADYFLAARDRAVNAYPWIASLNIRSDGKLDGAQLDLRDVPLGLAIEGIVAIVNDCREQGAEVFGEKTIRLSIETQLRDIRVQLTAVGFPEDWP